MSRSDPLDFSIIVPTRDRHDQLTACLEAIARLDYPRTDYEVIVVDDGSDTTAEQALSLSAVSGFDSSYPAGRGTCDCTQCGRRTSERSLSRLSR